MTAAFDKTELARLLYKADTEGKRLVSASFPFLAVMPTRWQRSKRHWR
ncbi:hypothetical protein P6U16_12015 [Rhizobium sp. 32-5/1]|nr:hypothetical protein [Rhizobium sp. 32-5/1]WEZ81978.1 hypothetical protein P6U16_12015 [Rhizobium sp. 32-5/1]